MQGHLPGCSEEAGLLQSLFLMENLFYTPRTCPSLSSGTRISSPVQELKDGSSSSLACPALSGTVGRESGTCAHNPNPTFQTLSVWRSVRKSPELIRFRNSPSPHPPAQIGAHLKGKSPEDATLVKCNTLKGPAIFSCLIPGAECQFPSAAMELVSLVSWPRAWPCRRMGKGAVCANRGAVTGPAAASPRHHFTILRVC